MRRRPAAGRRCGTAAASSAGAPQNLARCDILREQPSSGRRETASNVERRPAQCARRRLISLLLLISACYLYRTAHSDGSGEVSVGGVTDETDRYEYFVVLNEIFAYASIEIFRWARRFAHVNGSGYRIFCGSLLNGFFPLWPTDSCKRCPLNRIWRRPPNPQKSKYITLFHKKSSKISTRNKLGTNELRILHVSIMC